MNKIKKIVNAIALSAILLVPTAMSTSAISNDAQGSATDLTFDGTYWTVAMMNCNMDDACGEVEITNFGDGSGNIYFGAYCCRSYDKPVEHYYTFKKKGKKTFTDQTSGLWGVDGTNTKKTKKRYSVDVRWDLT